MRILLSDYSGHPFQVQLSRELARRGHSVRHCYSARFQTPKGNLIRQPGDPAGFEVVPLHNAKPFAKASFVRRRRQEIEIGRALAAQVADFAPDIVVSSNAPLDTQRLVRKAARRRGARFVFWLQDIYSQAISSVVPRKMPIAGHAIAAWYRRLEFTLLRSSDRIIAITDDFVPILTARRVARDKITVIENWAPTGDLFRHPRDTAWAAAHMPQGLRIVYSGTLGYKHNPGLLVTIARQLPDAQVLVFSEGDVADGLAANARRQGMHNLQVHPWVSFADLPKMLSAADIFIAMVEPGAGVYSVPSKILTYLAIGRPIVASVPAQNLAARLIERAGAGFSSAPGDDAPLLSALERLVADGTLRAQLGDRGRSYAHQAFDITAIADQFLTAFGG